MNSKKSMLLIVALAVLGGIVFSQVDISPAITFILGVLASAFVVNFSSTDSKSDSEPKASTKTLYVGNLPYKANESHVRELFSEHGEVFAVRLMKDKRTGKRRGFGFVVVATKDADNVIENLNNNEFDQRTLKVRIANDPKTSGNPNTEEN